MRNLFRNAVVAGSVLTSLTMLVSLLVAAGPARAYSPDPSVYWISQDADRCYMVTEVDPLNRYWTQDLSDEYGLCYIWSSHTHSFELDAGGLNLLLELYQNGTRVGEIQFEANGEYLTVEDSRNDDDTFYVWVGGNGPYSAGTSDDPVDLQTHNLSLTDGEVYSLRITDDRAGNDVIASSSGSLPYVVP
jgi:hypothetical protein